MHPTINSELLSYISLGYIKPHGDIKRFGVDFVEFVDGTKEKFDIVVFATGYHIGKCVYVVGFMCRFPHVWT